MKHGSNRRAMAGTGTAPSQAPCTRRQAWASLARSARRAQWHSVGAPYRGAMEGPSRPLSSVPDVPSALSELGAIWRAAESAAVSERGSPPTRQTGHERVLHRRLLQRGKTRGDGVGKTKRGKGSKIMAIADGAGLPVSIVVASASPHEVTLVEETVNHAFAPVLPERMIGDKAYDSDPLDAQLADHWGVELIAPHRSDRRHPTQDGRGLRRYRRRWKAERLFAWLHNFRRLVIRYEYHMANFLGMLQLACALILLRHL